jgi:hypothetical protein
VGLPVRTLFTVQPGSLKMHPPPPLRRLLPKMSGSYCFPFIFAAIILALRLPLLFIYFL